MSAVSGLWSQSERLWNPGITADKTRETFEIVRENVEAQANGADTKVVQEMFASVIENTTVETITTSAIIMLVFESISLFAAYLMYNLEKRGFYLYLAGIAVAFLAPIVLIGGWLGFITAASSIFLSVFMAIFYAINFKYLQ
ncbi:hypothetical protein E0F88_20265 [Dyadobacter psychrotolerans]|uniref:Uncharacterized protein n=2 Tax=Dyadobacter psychrotolerans TaxID=2541721 RepID=A0A4R5DHT0_9BACT|nr:hypothetical protein E0F88_20265 [Dyadobacter psychrotolerans]